MLKLTKLFSFNKQEGDRPYKLGFVLGGGGARGYAHLGMIEAFQEKGIQPDIISGVSAGSIIGAFICAGIKPSKAFSIIRDYDFISLSRIRFPSMGLLNLKTVNEMIEKEIGYERLEDLPMPLIITASNLTDGKVRRFKEGYLPDLVQASSSIPVLFSPVEIEGKLYCDGGLYDNLPYKPLDGMCEKTVGLSISPVEKSQELRGIVQIASRTFQLSVNANIANKRDKFDVFLEPKDLRDFDVLDTKNSVEIFEMGYKYAKKYLEKNPSEFFAS